MLVLEMGVTEIDLHAWKTKLPSFVRAAIEKRLPTPDSALEAFVGQVNLKKVTTRASGLT
jgi:hypothetical protein